MPVPRIITLSSRTATVLVTPGARYALDPGLAWQLTRADGAQVAAGEARTAVIFLDNLTPQTSYDLHIGGQVVPFTTRMCAGLIAAADYGVSAKAHDNRDAFASAIAAVPTGGTLHVPAGRYLTGPIFLKSQMTLLLDAGAVIAAVATRDGWPQLPANGPDGRVLGTWEGEPAASFAAVVTAIDCADLTITGSGTIDGGGDRGDWWSWPKGTRDGARRPRALHLAYCDHARISGVTICNAPSWTVHPYRCNDLKVAAVTIQNPPDSPNTDGLNPESCVGVALVGLSFSVGDDCIAIKAGKRGAGDNAHLAPCRDITISHCLMRRGHGAVVLGSEMSGDIRNVTISDCDFIGTDRGLRLKTRRGRGGVIGDVAMRRVTMQDVATPIAANAFYFCDADGKDDWVQSRAPAVVGPGTPQISGIVLEDITALNVSVAAVALLGLPEAPITDVLIRNMTVTYDPAARPAVPLMALHVPPVRHGGVIANFAAVSGALTLPSVPEAIAP